ncbi:Mitochondrial 2-oxodicarboxylate carrier [Tupaia chinensis]|uniref:Mitochondrial 2-oxodicarboxylate carrier n=1 Tax=Tupaia chinensis TaxID=246437 RepID=L9KL00_TUPCH|nr:Mitochondrial 2-oxodicarboxylate carrier [Tupaia chinensis]
MTFKTVLILEELLKTASKSTDIKCIDLVCWLSSCSWLALPPLSWSRSLACAWVLLCLQYEEPKCAEAISEGHCQWFFTFEQYKKLLGYVSLSPALTFAIAGLGSGLTEAIVVNPFEVVKVGLQANRNTFTEQPSTIGYARQIIKKEGLGLQGLNKGFTATLGRHGVFNMVYFGFYFNVKNIIPVNKDPTLEFLRKFGIGLLSGTIASVINIPFDVAKSRIQGPQPVPGEIKYRTCFKTMATVYQEEGILALYKGLLPKIMRLGPGGAVMLLVYEYTYSWLQENW